MIDGHASSNACTSNNKPALSTRPHHSIRYKSGRAVVMAVRTNGTSGTPLRCILPGPLLCSFFKLFPILLVHRKGPAGHLPTKRSRDSFSPKQFHTRIGICQQTADGYCQRWAPLMLQNVGRQLLPHRRSRPSHHGVCAQKKANGGARCANACRCGN